MKISRVTACVQVKKDFGACFDFYTEKLGLIPIYGDRTEPYANFANCKDGEQFFAMYCAKDAATRIGKYNPSEAEAGTDALSAVFHTTDFEGVYSEWSKAGVNFIDKFIVWGFAARRRKTRNVLAKTPTTESKIAI